jgi:hypothetical protein
LKSQKHQESRHKVNNKQRELRKEGQRFDVWFKKSNLWLSKTRHRYLREKLQKHKDILNSAEMIRPDQHPYQHSKGGAEHKRPPPPDPGEPSGKILFTTFHLKTKRKSR